MILIILFVLGLIVGSFLNVLIYRLHTAEEFLRSRSKCPHCQKLIRWYDNIPLVSFIILKARCRECDKKISWQYPIVEILTGIIFAAVGWKFFDPFFTDSWITTTHYLFVCSALIVILVYDWLHYEIPSSVLWVAVFAAAVFNLWADFNGSLSFGSLGMLGNHSFSGNLAAILAFSFFFALSAGSKEKWMGMGDAYLAILIGLFLGWPEILLALFLAFFIGAVYGIIMVVMGQKKMKSQVPFAPFIIAGTFINLLFYEKIAEWYLRLNL